MQISKTKGANIQDSFSNKWVADAFQEAHKKIAIAYPYC